MADMPQMLVTATRDLAAIVLFDGSIGFAAWNRAADRPIDLGTETDDEGEIVYIEVIGSRVIVARSCNEYCSSVARIIDARGRRHGGGFYTDAVLGGERESVMGLDADHFVALGAFGEVAMIEHGRVAASSSLLPGPPQRAVIRGMVRLDDRALAVLWCPESDSNPTCHLTRLGVRPEQPRVKPGIEAVEDRLLPRCPRG